MSIRFQGVTVFLGPMTKPGEVNQEINNRNMKRFLNKQSEIGLEEKSLVYYNHPFAPSTIVLATSKDAEKLEAKYGDRLYPDWTTLMRPIDVEALSDVTLGDKAKRLAAKYVFNPLSAIVETQVKSTIKMNEIIADLARAENMDIEGKPVQYVRFEEFPS